MSKLSKVELKKELRIKFLEKRDGMDFEKRREASTQIMEWVFANKRFKNAQTVFVYVSYKSEVDTKAIILQALKLGKRVAVPKIHGYLMDFYEIHSWDELFPGSFGILEPQVEGREPMVPAAGDVMLVPGAVFDRQGGRMGYGKGYYDRYLHQTAGTYGSMPYLIGLAFAGQISPKKLPSEEHDKKMDCILTERRVIMPRVEKGGKLDVIADVVEIAIEVGLELVTELID